MKLEDLEIYQLSIDIGEIIWELVISWKAFEKYTVGKQIVRSVDSIAANISEGFGSFHYKDSKNFYYYARGSIYETKTFLIKANNRNLISDEEFENLLSKVKSLGIKLNNFINTIAPPHKSDYNKK